MGDDIETYPRKLFDNTITALILARDQLPLEAIERAVDYLAEARHIYFWDWVHRLLWQWMPNTNFFVLKCR